MKTVFLDCEFTSAHAWATLISVGMVTLEGDELYVTLDDYDRDQVTDWVRTHVLSQIDESQSVSRLQAVKRIAGFLEAYSSGERVALISAGKSTDILLVFQLWHELFPERKYFHFECLPEYLRHRAHYDLDTLFGAAGIDPDSNREKLIGVDDRQKHDAIFDARIVRQCFLMLREKGKLPLLWGY